MTVFAWMGVLVAVLLSGTLLVGTFGWAVETCKNFYVHLSYKAEELARRDVGTRLIRESYWYSEDEPVMAALQIIGKNLAQQGYVNISDCRDEWRNRKGKTK